MLSGQINVKRTDALSLRGNGICEYQTTSTAVGENDSLDSYFESFGEGLTSNSEWGRGERGGGLKTLFLSNSL